MFLAATWGGGLFSLTCAVQIVNRTDVALPFHWTIDPIDAALLEGFSTATRTYDSLLETIHHLDDKLGPPGPMQVVKETLERSLSTVSRSSSEPETEAEPELLDSTAVIFPSSGVLEPFVVTDFFCRMSPHSTGALSSLARLVVCWTDRFQISCSK